MGTCCSRRPKTPSDRAYEKMISYRSIMRAVDKSLDEPPEDTRVDLVSKPVPADLQPILKTPASTSVGPGFPSTPQTGPHAFPRFDDHNTSIVSGPASATMGTSFGSTTTDPRSTLMPPATPMLLPPASQRPPPLLSVSPGADSFGNSYDHSHDPYARGVGNPTPSGDATMGSTPPSASNPLFPTQSPEHSAATNPDPTSPMMLQHTQGGPCFEVALTGPSYQTTPVPLTPQTNGKHHVHFSPEVDTLPAHETHIPLAKTKRPANFSRSLRLTPSHSPAQTPMLKADYAFDAVSSPLLPPAPF